jgi:hypothetical protein
MNEEWARWEPVPNLVNRYYIDSVHNDSNGFTIVLSEDRIVTNKVYIRFKDWVNAYRQTDETFRANLIHELHEKYGAKFYSQWSFFKVRNSSYISWLSAESSTISDNFELTHFVVFDPNNVIDVVAGYEPTIEFMVEKPVKEDAG